MHAINANTAVNFGVDARRGIMARSGSFTWCAVLISCLVCLCNGERPDQAQKSYAESFGT
jgi:hypothetical protein